MENWNSEAEAKIKRNKGLIVWTEKNVKALKYLIHRNENNETIAKVLDGNKTEEAIVKKREELGI